VFLAIGMAIAVAWPLAAQDAGRPLRFRIRLSEGVAPNGSGGRLLVLMSDAPEKRETLRLGFLPGRTWVAAMELEHLSPGQPVEFDADRRAYPMPFSQAKPGAYQFMALLDVDHSFAHSRQGPGDLRSTVVAREISAANAEPVELSLDQIVEPAPSLAGTEAVKLVEFESPRLSAFWGRPIVMRAGVVLPGDGAKRGRYPTVYHVHGFGGDHREAWRRGPAMVKSMSAGKSHPMAHVFLDASFSTGHHVFADSVNNGPWGTALTRELIPHLEKQFPLVRHSRGRFLTGHSSGGWSTLWLQVTYPDFFGGTWSTAPDPVDLRAFTGVDATPGSGDNVYRRRDGSARPLTRAPEGRVCSFEQFVRYEEVLGECGGQIASFEWVWSPRGRDGRPMRLFNRGTGAQDPAVQRAWQAYDIRRILEQDWARLGPKMRGKLHVFCGEQDTFQLDEGVRLLREFLRGVDSDAVCELVPGRNHGNLYQPYKTYPQGLAKRIDDEIWSTWQNAK
jgi:S-formylglutathione hydrolase FrmB